MKTIIKGKANRDQYGTPVNRVAIYKKIKGQLQKVADLEIRGGKVSRRITCEILDSIWKE